MTALFIDGPLKGRCQEFDRDYPSLDYMEHEPFDEGNELAFPSFKKVTYYRIDHANTGAAVFSVLQGGPYTREIG